MVYRLTSPGFARQLDADFHTLFHRGQERRVSFGDRLLALDRIAGMTLVACTMAAVVGLAGVTADAGLWRIPTATADSASLAADAQTARPAADFLKWSEVRTLQTRLSQLGFDAGKPDGIAGPRTLEALNRYRETKSLDRVVWVDRNTIADLLD